MLDDIIGSAISGFFYGVTPMPSNSLGLQNTTISDSQRAGMRAMSQEEIVLFNRKLWEMCFGITEETKRKAAIIHEHCLTGRAFDTAEPIYGNCYGLPSNPACFGSALAI